MPAEPEPAPAAGVDGRYYAAVGALLVVIIAVLGVLWLRERRMTAALQRELAETRQRTATGAGLQAALSRLAAPRGPTTRPLARADLPAETVTWNGRSRTVLRVGAAAGRRLGLEPGDVIVVSPPPAGGADE